ncbi:MAG: hypothetical protein IKV52_00885 [Oscillospiraceae bacterium]|nr:hypothetical protein [Oscillospiraceae bacterium]
MKSFKDFVKLSAKLLLLVPVFAFMVFCNWRIDPSGLFFGAGFERIASEYMLEGHTIKGYERLDGRKLNEVYAKNVPYAPQVLINGSSRTITLSGDMLCPGKTFYNAANVGADKFDFFTSYYIFAKEGKEPETMVLSFDAWLFNADKEAIDDRSDKQLCYQFLNEELGFKQYDYTTDDSTDREKYKALVSPSYFQAAIRYYLRDTSGELMPEIVRGDPYTQNEIVKTSDGSVIYDIGYRNRTRDEIDYTLITETYADAPLMCMYNFKELDSEFIMWLEAFVEYLQAKDINIIFYMPPYHEHFYNVAESRIDEHPAYFLVEDYLADLADRYDIPLYGGFDAEKLGLVFEDFWDSYHMVPESINKVLPVIE